MRTAFAVAGLRFLLLLFASSAFAQSGGKPLSLDAVEGLLKGGVTAARVAGLVGEKGISFEMTGDARARLERAGADADLFAAIERAAAARAPTPLPVSPTQAPPPPMEAQRLAEPEPTEGPSRTALVVRTNVSGDDVEIDGWSVGGSGPKPRDVSPGRHTVTVKRKGYRTVERDVEVRAGETKIVSLELKPIEEAVSVPERLEGTEQPPIPATARATSFCENAYFPISPTAKRVMRTTYKDGKTRSVTSTSTFEYIQADSFTERGVNTDGQVGTTSYRCSEAGIQRDDIRWTGVRLPPAKDMRAGMTWNESFQDSPQGRVVGFESSYQVLGREVVTVPAGSYSALVVRVTARHLSDGSRGPSSTHWYAEDVGFVKQDNPYFTEELVSISK